MKLKVLEYLAAGLPVVGTPEAFVGFAAPERFALVCATATMTDLPSLVAELLADPRLRHRLGHTGRRLVERCYSWRAMAQLAREAYAAILDSHPHPGVARTAQLVEWADQAPYWLHEGVAAATPNRKAPPWRGTPAAGSGPPAWSARSPRRSTALSWPPSPLWTPSSPTGRSWATAAGRWCSSRRRPS
ncbi:MAG: glycosyltransferase [Pseudonocardiaceae bacterium]